MFKQQERLLLEVKRLVALHHADLLSCIFGRASDETLDGNQVERRRDVCVCVSVYECAREEGERERGGEI